MGGYDDNEAVTKHTYATLAQSDEDLVDNIISQDNQEYEPLPQLHKDWISPS